jgi:NADPH-dependent 2,4-dienoyl-CoA reductase/sulfur reductase-like enzyme
MRIVVIGAGAAGLAAATRAKRVKPDAEVVVFEATGEFSRGTCSLPYFLSRELDHPKFLQGATEADLREKGIDLRLHTKALRILPHQRTLHTEAERVQYDKLVVSTGSRSRSSGLNLCHNDSRVWRLRTVADVLKIKEQLQFHKYQTVGVIGGGYVGIEFAEALHNLGLKTTLFHRQPELMRLRPEISEEVTQLLQRRGVTVFLNHDVKEASVNSSRAEVCAMDRTTGQTTRHHFDALALAVGIEPETHLLSDAGARLGTTGAVIVNSRGETSLSNVFACGDGVEIPNSEGGPGRWVPLATTAARLGRVCGENAANGGKRLGSHLGALCVRLFDRQLGVLGQPRDWTHSEHICFQWGQPDHPFPRRREGCGVVFSDRRTGRIQGLQALGPEAGHLVDLVSLAADRGLTLEDLQDQDFCYTPPLSGLWSPLYLAARKASKRDLSGGCRP